MKISPSMLNLYIALVTGEQSLQTHETVSEELSLSHDFERLCGQIEQYGRQQDEEALLALAETVHREWPQRSAQQYADLLLRTGVALQSRFRQAETNHDAIEQIARKALHTYDQADKDNFSIEMHYRLVGAIPTLAQHSAGAFTGAEWAAARAKHVRSIRAIRGKLISISGPRLLGSGIIAASTVHGGGSRPDGRMRDGTGKARHRAEKP